MLSTALIAAFALTPDATVSAFSRLCAKALPSRDILAAADRQGWQSNGPGTPADFDQSTTRFKDTDHGVFILRTSETASAGEVRQTCGISSQSGDADIVSAAQKYLGFAPEFSTPSAATWYAALDGKSWRSIPDQAAWQSARAHSQSYSIMVNTDGKSSQIYDLRVEQPAMKSAVR